MLWVENTSRSIIEPELPEPNVGRQAAGGATAAHTAPCAPSSHLGRVRLGVLAVSLLFISGGGLGCRDATEKTRKREVTVASPVHAASVGAATGPTDSEEVPIERARLDGPAPPSTPPGGAQLGPLGVRTLTVRAGEGPLPEPGHRWVLELRAWNDSGELLTDTLANPKPLELSPGNLPEPLRVELAKQRVGTHLQLWLPAAATQGFRLAEWPREGQLRLELMVLGTREPLPATVRQIGSLSMPQRFAPPSVSGPSPDAKTAAGGIRYEWLQAGPEGSQPRQGSQLRLSLSAHSMSGVVVSKVLDDQLTTMTMGQAPAGLQPVLDHMVVGDTVRVWLPEERARQVLPQVSSAAVMDVTLLDIK